MRARRISAIACLALGMAGLGVIPAHAQTTLYVTSCTDGALRSAVNQANTDNDNDTIAFTCGGDYDLTSPLNITGTMTINPGNGTTVRINGQNSTQLFTVASGVTLTLEIMTLENGKAVDGAAISNSGTLNLSHVVLAVNEASGRGGAIFNTGTVNATLSYFQNGGTNGEGGAIYNDGGTVNVDHTTFLSNSAKNGAGIENHSGTLNISQTTFDTNGTGALGNGGGILNYGTATINDSTFSGNYAQADGGALYNSGGTVTIHNSTLAGDRATTSGGEIANVSGGTVNLGADIIANSISGGNCYNSASTLTDQGYNLEYPGPTTCGLSSGLPYFDIIGQDPMLSSLRYNGVPSGPTETEALLPGSPAIDYIPTGVPNNLCPATGATDQRDYPRPDSNEVFCDIGAYEYQDGYVLPGSSTAYDIESSNFACPGGGSACVPTGSYASDCLMTIACPGLSYGDAEAFGRPNNTSNGLPDELVLFCAHGTATGYDAGFLDVISSQGNTDYSGGIYGNADVGTISGKGTLLGGGGAEDNPSQASSINASGYDHFTGVIGSVAGTQNTDNNSDTLNSGTLTVTLRGTLLHVDTTGSSPTFDTYSGTISCTVGGTHAADLANAGVDSTSLAEAELENTLGDNAFAANLINQLRA